MADYTKTNWQNETPNTTPLKYKITDDVGGVVANSAKIELLTTVTAGTPVDASHMNHIEDGIFTAQQTGDNAHADAAAAQADATSALANAAAASAARKMQAGYAQVDTVSTTSGTTFTDVAGMSVSLTLPAQSTILAMFTGNAHSSGASYTVRFKILIDGWDGNTSGFVVYTTVGYNSGNVAPVALNLLRTGVAAGARTIKVQAACGEVGAGAGTLYRANLTVLAFQEN